MKREGWITKCIGDCFSYIKNGANIKQEKNASGYPITRIETLANGVFNRDRMGYADIFDIGKYNVNVLQDQDILMSHINSKAYIGRSVIYQKKENETIIHGMNLLRLIAKKDFLNPQYANYYFKTEYFKNDVAKIRKDAVNQSSMAISDLSKIKMPIPPLPEQSRIVEELDLLSNIIEKKRQQLSELDNLAQSIFYDMFGDPVTNEKGWEVKKLEDVSSIISGFAFNSSDFSSENTIKAIKITNVGVNEFIEDNMSLPSKYNDKQNYMVKAGDIVIALTRTVISTGLKRAIVPINYDGALVNQRVAAIIVNEKVVYKSFLYNYLGTDFVKEYVLAHATALMQPNLSINDLKKLPIYFPPLSLQQLFAKKIEAIEKQKELIKQSIAETEELFNSRMDYYFS